MKKINPKDKQILIGLLGLIAYIMYYILNILMGGLYLIDYLFASTFLSIAVILIIIKLNKEKFVKDYKDFIKNFKTYIDKYIKYYLIGLLFMFLFNILNTYIFDIGVTENESTIRSVIEILPIYIFISAVLIGPILEELVFRLSFKNVFKNKYVFIIISSLLFSYLHMNATFSSAIDLLYLLPYLPLGVAFAYILVKSKNIFTTIAFHTFHNGILVLFQIILVIIT